MTISALQSKLNSALVTNAAGDYALRTMIEGDQDLGGGYISNEQTTVNMMSKGTVYRFDGVNDKIVITDDADIDIGTNDFTLASSFYTPDLTNPLPLWYQYQDNDNRIRFQVDTDGSLSFFARVGATSVANYSTAAGTIVIDRWYDSVAFTSDRDGTKGQFYVNGVPITTTETVAMATSSFVIAGNVNIGYDPVTTDYGKFSASLTRLDNMYHSAAEIKDFSGNIPFKWQYGSQTAIENYAFTASLEGWDAFNDWASQTNPAANMVLAADGATQTCRTGDTPFTAGKRYRITYTASSTTDAPSFKYFTTGRVNLVAITGTNVISDGTNSFDFIWPAASTNGFLYIDSNSATAAVTLDDIIITAVGAVALYDQTSISETTWYDKANGNDGAVTGASVLNRPKNDEHEGIVVNGGFLNLGSPVNLTIASGVITATQSNHTVDTEAAGAADDLDTINGGKDGDILMLSTINNGRDVTAKDGTGNLRIAGDFAMLTAVDILTLKYNAGNWEEISRSTN